MDFYDAAADLYDHTFGRAEGEGERGDVAFYVEEARRAGSPVLDLACGTGRVLIPIAHAGVPVTGLDRSPAMLAAARKKVARLPAAARERIELIEDDLRSFSLDRRFELVIIPFRSFLHLMTPADQRRALGRIREHLAEEGRLVFNIFDPRLDVIASHLGHRANPLEKESEFTHPGTGRQVVEWVKRRYDGANQTVEEERVLEELEGGRVVSRTCATLALRWIYRYEMEHLLELSGLAVEALYGGFDRGPFYSGGEQVWVARKA